MYQLNISIAFEQAEALETYFCEEYQEHWLLYENEKLKTHELRGYFADEAESVREWAALRDAFPELSGHAEGRPLPDTEWKDAYKLHFKPWSDRGLHFVPEWERSNYPVPDGDAVVLLDPGMAFGTGNHETTRLCIHRILDARERWGGDIASKSVIDAGCGSGILAISALKVGFGGPISAFDNDPDSVRIAGENAELCGIPRQIEFRWSDLQEGLAHRTADLVLANILAPVLQAHAEILVNAVAPGGELILSGILCEEVEALKSHFEVVARTAWGSLHADPPSLDGQWADIRLVRPD